MQAVRHGLQRHDAFSKSSGNRVWIVSVIKLMEFQCISLDSVHAIDIGRHAKLEIPTAYFFLAISIPQDPINLLSAALSRVCHLAASTVATATPSRLLDRALKPIGPRSAG